MDTNTENVQRSEVLDKMKNYSAIPNHYVDRIMSYLTSDEWKVVSYACRRIFGFQKEEDHISISQFTNGAMMYDGSGFRDRGTGLSKDTVAKCLKSLSEVGIMKMMAKNNPRANKGALWGLELDYDKINIQALEERAEQMLQVNQGRMKKVRAGRKEVIAVE